MQLTRVVLDERTWSEAEEARRAELRAAMHELTADPELELLEGGHTLVITTHDQSTEIELRDEHGATLASVTVGRDALKKHVTEYVDIVRRMAKADAFGGGPSLEALDMGKKLAHDDAARTLEKLVAPLAADHWTCRKLFTLLFALRVDPAHLTGFRAHRPVR